MPSGPKKRHAARRRSMGERPGPRTSLDKANISDSHFSDEGVSPKSYDFKNSRLSLFPGTSQRPGDQTFQTEEWVRVSDFDVGTPTSTTTKSDIDAQDSFGDVRGLDKFVDWETVFRESAGNSSSAEEVGEAGLLVAEDSSGSGRKQGQKLPYVDVVLSGLDSEKEDDEKSVRSNRSVSGKKFRSSTSTSTSSSTGSRSYAYPKESDGDGRSSSIVLGLSLQECEVDSQKSSYLEVASSEPLKDDYHGSLTVVSSLEMKYVYYEACSTIEPASLEEQEEDNYDLLSGIEDHASSAIEAISSEEHEDEFRLFTEDSKVKELEELQSSSDAVDLSSLILSESGEGSFWNESVLVEFADHHSLQVEGARIGEPKVMKKEHQTSGHLNTKYDEVLEYNETNPETPKINNLSQEVIYSTASEPYAQSHPEFHPAELDTEGRSAVEESMYGIEPRTLEKTIVTEAPYTFLPSVRDEEILGSAKASSLEVVLTVPSECLLEAQGVEKTAANVHDTSVSSGIPEPLQEELDQLIVIPYSKEIADLGNQEVNIRLHEEQELGKGSVERQPFEVSSTTESSFMEGLRLSIRPAVVDKALFLKGFSSLVDSKFCNTAELKDGVPGPFIKESGEKSLEESQGGVREEHPTAEASFIDSIGSEELLTDNVKGALVPPTTITDPEWPKHSAESAEDVEVIFEADNVYQTERIVGSTKQLKQAPYERREDQPRGLIQASSNTWGCCEPVQWLFSNLRRWVIPAAI